MEIIKTKDGLFFGKGQTEDVYVFKTSDGKQPNEFPQTDKKSNVMFSVKLEKEWWESIIEFLTRKATPQEALIEGEDS